MVFRIGKPDHEAYIRNQRGLPEEKSWTYFPHPRDPQTLTIITFRAGVVVNVVGNGGKVASPIHLPGGAANAALMLRRYPGRCNEQGRAGSCNPTADTILLNTELAKKPRECLEYIVVHELVHLLEPTHNERFIKLMDQHMPKWKSHRQLLNSLPVRHENWGY